MLKKITFAGFETKPDLQDRIDRLIPSVEDELGTAADRVSIAWTLLPADVDQPEKVQLRLDDEWAAGPLTTRFLPQEFADAHDLRVRIRKLHGSMLDAFLRRQVERMKRDWAEATEG